MMLQLSLNKSVLLARVCGHYPVHTAHTGEMSEMLFQVQTKPYSINMWIAEDKIIKR